jgi:hypothetical protein
MKPSIIAIVVLGAGLAIGSGWLLWLEHKPANKAQPAVTPVAAAEPPPVPPPPPPRPRPQAPPPVTQEPAVPAGATVGTPGAAVDPDAPIRAAPPAQVKVVDHRGEKQSRIHRSMTTAGIQVATKALRAAVGRCFTKTPGVTLRFMLTASGGRARAADAQIQGGQGEPDGVACATQALQTLDWATPDPDGADSIALPLILK